ncbi:MAG TPA: Asp-tRNA(Asn)/Glu-tRNA(Gln) amidotransferase subunit GatA [Armatimonadaceae bacterium]|nr:Asp-tRNA(Asn)/Glu-tRNA(Gln) amidotransferase subunit GatA [Armatimonadaceae bacterium]
MAELHDMTAAQIADLLAKGEASAREVADAFLARVEAVDPKVRAFVTVTAEKARAQADAVDAKRRAGEPLGPLAGVPVALKDNLCTAGVETTCSSQILRGFVPPYSATVVEKLDAAGAVFPGKVNLDEFAMGSSTENSGLFVTANPWDLKRVPGGSSGGSAAAVAAGAAPLALGSDTGGSIRQPASFCGIVGLKPTYGRVSRYGLVAFASSLDQIGPMARTVEDAALLLNAISGHDGRDSTSVPRDVPDYRAALTGDVKGLRLGVPKEYFAEGVSAEVRERVLAAIEVLRGLGAVVDECSLPTTDYALAAYYIVAPAEASSNLARYDGVRYGRRTDKVGSHVELFERTREEGFGAEVKQRIMVGTYALSAGYYDAYYAKAQKVRTLIKREFEQVFSRFDAVVTPTAPTTAFAIGEKSDDPLAMKLSDICTIPANMAGIPALSQCCGFDAAGLPVGVQLMGPAFGEETLLRIAHAYEQATDWHTRRPAL